jgi:cell division protease FtsH
VPPPDIRGRKQILAVHSKRTPLGGDVNLDVLAKGTPGFSGADLENLVNEAALMAAKENKDFLSMSDFENAKDKLLMGKERRTMVQTPEDLRNTAYHEAGHAILNLLLPETDTLHKVTIIPRGRALGVTMYLPEEDKNTLTRVELESKITMAFGGRAAELIIFSQYTTGAANDIKQATNLARSMVCKWGMSDVVGPMAVGEQSQEVFIGREWVANKDHSEETSRLVDSEVKRIIDTAMERADTLLRAHIDSLLRVAEALLERETITGDEVRRLMEGETLPPLDLKAYPRKLVTTKDLQKGTGSGGEEKEEDSPPSSPAPPAPPALLVAEDGEASPAGGTGQDSGTGQDGEAGQAGGTGLAPEAPPRSESSSAPPDTAGKGHSPLGAALSGKTGGDGKGGDSGRKGA